MKQIANWERSVFVSLAAGVVLAPLAFGGMTAWFTDIFAAVAGIYAIAGAVLFLNPSGKPTFGFRAIAIPGILYAIVVLWCFLQATVPVAQEIAHEAWRDAGEILHQTARPVLSLNPEASIAGALRLSGYGIVFILSYLVVTNEARAIRLLTVIALSGAAYAIYGIVLELSDSKYVLWYPRTFEPGNLSSTFPNRNAFASYAILCLLCVCTILYRRRIRVEDMSTGWRRALVSVVRFYLRRNGWALYTAAILFAAILMTHSRAGLATVVLAFAVFVVCAMRAAAIKSAAAAGSAFIVVCAIGLVWMLGGTTADRFDRIQAASTERFEIYRLTITGIAERPVFGTGLGTFRDVFPEYRTPNLRSHIDYAHNSYLENALEMGVPAAAALYVALAILLIMYIRSWLKRDTRHPYPALGIATITAVLIHSLFDYATQFPAVAITFAVILGIAAAQSFGPPPPDVTPEMTSRRK